MIQVFANEYCKPTDIVLIIGSVPNNVRNIFTFINSDTIIIDSVKSDHVDIVIDYKTLIVL